MPRRRPHIVSSYFIKMMLSYCLDLRGLREHWLRDYPGKRSAMLARSGVVDASALGAILWSGDVAARWDVLRAQVTQGLKIAYSGISWWTLDIGAFFVGQKEQWFWRGDYLNGVNDSGYRELYVRRFQFGAMLPVFRAHGTDTPREPWAFGEDDSPAYRCLCDMIALRYRLLPCLYATAAQACREGGRRITVPTPLERFPASIRAGSILPAAESAQGADDLPLPSRELWIFEGRDGARNCRTVRYRGSSIRVPLLP